MKVFFIRHAESTTNVTQIHECDPKLTYHGEHQALQLATFLKKHHIKHIWCSRMLRAMMTIYPYVQSSKNIHVELYQDLVEIGGFRKRSEGKIVAGSGLSSQECIELFPNTKCMDGESCIAGEYTHLVEERIHKLLKRLQDRSEEYSSLAILSHGEFMGWVLNALILKWRGLPLKNLDQNIFALHNTSISLFEITSDRIQPIFINHVLEL